MMEKMDRRGFLQSIIILCAAPAIIKIDRLMRVRPIITGAEAIEVYQSLPIGSSIPRLFSKKIISEFYEKSVIPIIITERYTKGHPIEFMLYGKDRYKV